MPRLEKEGRKEGSAKWVEVCVRATVHHPKQKYEKNNPSWEIGYVSPSQETALGNAGRNHARPTNKTNQRLTPRRGNETVSEW